MRAHPIEARKASVNSAAVLLCQADTCHVMLGNRQAAIGTVWINSSLHCAGTVAADAFCFSPLSGFDETVREI
jgi:hypothetical protein